MVCNDGDIPALVDLAHVAHEESRFGYIPFCEARVRDIARRAINNPDRQAVMLALRGRRALGFSYCSVGEYHIGADVLLTTIHVIYVAREVRSGLSGGRVALGLFKGIETWSKARGVSEVLFHVTSGVDLTRSHKLAKRMGYELIGGSYAKRTPNISR